MEARDQVIARMNLFYVPLFNGTKLKHPAGHHQQPRRSRSQTCPAQDTPNYFIVINRNMNANLIGSHLVRVLHCGKDLEFFNWPTIDVNIN